MNMIILQGNLTHDPEVMAYQGKDGTERKLAKFSIATQDSGLPVEFFNCVAFSNVANFIEKYFRKGNKILVRGRVQTEKWEDKDGNARKTQRVYVATAEFCEKAPKTEDENPFN